MLKHRFTMAALCTLALSAPAGGCQSAAAGVSFDKLTDFVRVETNATLGPFGYVSTPALTGANQLQGVDPAIAAANLNFSFPSIVFSVSAVPVVAVDDLEFSFVNDPDDDTLTKEERKKKLARARSVTKALETRTNPRWLDVTFQLEVYKGKAHISCNKGDIQIIGVLPQQNVATTVNSKIADAATTANTVADTLSTFYPGTKAEVTSSTKALNVVFQDLFPPHPIALQYANTKGNCEVGWYFRPNPTGGSVGEASILGMQTGIVLLKVSKAVTRIDVNSIVVSEWNHRVSKEHGNMYVNSNDDVATLNLPGIDGIDFNALTSLSAFPALIARKDAMRIVHMAEEKDFDAFLAASQIKTTSSRNDFILNYSLAAYLAGTAKASTMP